jgi:hypothetical protein
MEKLSKDYPQYEPKSIAGSNPSHVVALENFVTEKESKLLLKQQNEWEYEYVEREVEQDVFERVVNENRTYSFATCGDVCERGVSSLLDRIEQVTGIPNENSEYMELRKYKQGQRKALDHDHQDFERHHPQGIRVATLHMFLSDSDKNNGGGGALWIPSFNATIEPKFGRAVFWVNVLDRNPDSMDPSMQYSIEPPVTEEGTQYSATVYFHQRDYKHAEKWACHEPQNDLTAEKV